MTSSLAAIRADAADLRKEMNVARTPPGLVFGGSAGGFAVQGLGGTPLPLYNFRSADEEHSR